MATTVLRDIGETLKLLLRKNIPELSDDSSVVFSSPAELEAATSPKLSVFLYQISENSHLRNCAMEEYGEPALKQKMQYPPAVLDLCYLFTPYAQSKETELIIMERVVGTFHDNSILKGEVLQGGLQQTGNKELKIVSSPLSLEDLNRLWGIFPNKAFKLSVAYLVSPVRVPSSRETTVTRVVQREVDMYRVDR